MKFQSQSSYRKEFYLDIGGGFQGGHDTIELFKEVGFSIMFLQIGLDEYLNICLSAETFFIIISLDVPMTSYKHSQVTLLHY